MCAAPGASLSVYLYTWVTQPRCVSALWLNPGVGWVSPALWCWPCPVLSCPVLCSQRVNGAVCEYGLPAGLGAGAGEAVWDAEPSSGGGAEVVCRHLAPPPPQHAGNTEQTPHHRLPLLHLPFSPTITCFPHRIYPRIHPWSEQVHLYGHPHPICVDWLDGQQQNLNQTLRG